MRFKILIVLNTMESPFNIPQFKDFPHFTFNFNDPMSITSVLNYPHGRSIAQAVSRQLPTAAARVQTRVWLCGIL
jgi:hypothetical protein